MIELRLTDAPEAFACEVIRSGVLASSIAAAGSTCRRTLAVILDRGSDAVGGLVGRTAWDWFYIEWLFVPSELRGRGLARRILQLAEDEAVKRGCSGAWLDTYSFQALNFYRRAGFTVFGELKDYPAGHARYFLCKRYGATSPTSRDVPQREEIGTKGC